MTRLEVPLGTTRDLAPFPFWLASGVPNMGGPIVTASGPTFTAASKDHFLRAFDTATGAELWQGRLPAGGQATPMTYRTRAAMGTAQGDSLVAFALE